MKNRLLSCLHIIFLLLALPSLSQAQQAIFNEVLPPEENSWVGVVYGITQDAQGYMWFTDGEGLHRYNGYHLTSYRHDPSNPGSLATNTPTCVHVDRKGYLWVGTYGKGLDRLDPATGIFTHFRRQPDDPASLNSDSVTNFLEDIEGNLWVGTQTGLSKMDQKTGKFVRFQHDPKDPFSLSKGRVRILYEDQQGTLWIGTGIKVSSIGPGEGGLNRLDKNSGKFIRYMHDPGNPHSLIDNRVLAIFEDSRGTFWVGTSGSGVHTMDRRKGVFERYFYNPAHPGKLSRPSHSYKNLPDSYISFITEDVIGAIWIGTNQNGLYRYDVNTQKMAHYESDTSSGFTDNSVWTAYTSREGVLWISTLQGGLFRMDPYRNHVPQYATGFPVFAICEDKSGLIWLGHRSREEGLTQINRSTGSIKRFLADTLNPHSLSNNRVWAIYEDRQGTLWIGTAAGLNRFNHKEQSFTRYPHDAKNGASLTSDTINTIYEDRQGSFWLGTNQGLNLMNRKNGQFTHYRKNPKDRSSLSSDTITCITEDRFGNLWIGTLGGGVNMFDRRTKKFKHYLDKGSILSILEDTESIIWVGTGRLGGTEAGLYHFNKTVDSFSRFIDSTGGLTPSTEVGSIVEDNHKNIWLHSSKGIFRLNSKRNEIKMYGKNYGVYFSEWAKAYKGPRGELFFANNTGYYAFFPDKLIRNSKPPQIVFSEFRMGDQPVKPGRDGPLRVPLAQAKEIRLNYNQNIFSFDFAGIHFSSPADNRHLFMLENLDKTWRKGDAEKTAYYYNVPPGRYIFRVKAASHEGVWVERAITIIVDPPWWRTWWAYVMYALLIAGGIWAIVYYRSRNLRRKNRLLEEKVTQRTKELNQQKEELQATLEDLKSTQAQLIHSEKMASLGELTAGIAHEIQNPLNFVNNFSEVNMELIDEIEKELTAGNKEEAIAIASDIKQNLEKTNHHGKRADAIVKGMLQHSRTSTGQKELTDINALADEYLRLGYHGLRAKDKSFNANIQTDFDENIGKLSLVPQDIGRVILNLVNNAFYSVMEKKKNLDLTGFENRLGLKPGETYAPTLSVSTKKLNDKIEIRVKDNGMGIPQKALDKIFQPFFTTKPPGHGTGLGLSLAYDIIKAHGGEIKVETKEGQGAEFIIQLPAI